MAWPPAASVNTKEHAAAFATGLRRCRVGAPPLPLDVVETSAAPLVESALAGALLLDAPWSDRAFELAALALAEDPLRCTYVVSDARVTFGVNFPVERVLVLLPAGRLGLDEVRQLCGRAGRTGKAARAEVVFRDPEVLRLALAPRPPDEGRAPLDRLLD